jgi:hypothetical protein
MILTSRTERILQIGVIAVFVLPLLAHMLVGSHTRMMADDYCTSYMGRSQGLIGAFVTQYNTWAGQPSNILFKNAVGVFGTWVIPLLPLAVVVAWLAALVWTLTGIFKGLSIPRWLILLAAAICLFAILDGSPLVVQSLYWLAAVVPYTMPLVVATFYIGFLARVVRSDKPIGVPTLLISAVIGFVAGGFSETYVATQMAALLTGIGICVLSPTPALRKRTLPVLIAGLVGTVIVLAVILAAPGNAVRRSNFPAPPPLPTFVMSSVVQAVALVFASLTSFSPIGAILTVAGFAIIAHRYPPRVKAPISPVHVLAFLILLFLPVTAYLATGVYATGGVPPARTYIIPQMVIVSALALAGYAIGSRVKIPVLVEQRRPIVRLIGVLALIALVILGPVRTAVRTLQTLPAFQAFATEFDQREQLITAAKAQGETRLVVAPFTIDIAERVGLETIGDDPAFWVNGCAAQYYGLEAIVAE